MMKKEILQTISDYLDTIDIKEGIEGVIHTNSLYLEFNKQAYQELGSKLKEGEKFPSDTREKADYIIGKKLGEYYERNKGNMPWDS